MTTLSDIVTALNEEFSSFKGKDFTQNGLQVQATKLNQAITRVALSVDPSLTNIKRAVAFKSNLLICHHGLIWEPISKIDNFTFPIFRELFLRNLNVYVQHLPMDSHPNFSHSIILAKFLKLKNTLPFPSADSNFGVTGIFDRSFQKLIALLDQKLGTVNRKIIQPKPFKNKVLKLAVLSGSGSSVIKDAIEQGIEILITGEIKHSAEILARDFGLCVLCYGHRETELLGLQALADWLKAKFKLEAVKVF